MGCVVVVDCWWRGFLGRDGPMGCVVDQDGNGPRYPIPTEDFIH